jgi:putative phage-type endonuclease
MDQAPLRKVDLGEDDRKSFIGGSDSPVILGVSPFTTRKELWQEKMGLVEGKQETPAMKRGTTLEAIVADLYSVVKERKLEVVKQRIIHPNYPFIVAHIDRRITNDAKRGPGVWECKCPSMGVFNKCKREGLQEYYIIQMQHYLGVTGYKWGAFAIFSAELWELLEFDVVPDKEFIKIIFQEDEKFWKLVQQGIEPEEPPVKLDSEETKARAGLNPSELTNMDKINPGLWAEVTKRYQEAKQLKDDAEAYLDLCEEKIKAEMEKAGASVAEGSGARIYWKEQDGRKTLDKKGFAKENALAYAIYESFLKTGKPSRPFRAFFPRPIYHE